LSSKKQSELTNVIWLVKPEYFCIECGYAITKNTQSVCGPLHTDHSHKECFIKGKPQHGWMTADLMRKKADEQKEKA
jgi:hypothetical protein